MPTPPTAWEPARIRNVDAGIRDASDSESNIRYGDNRPVQVVNRNGQSTKLAYDQYFNLLACSERQGEHLVYAFDPAGNLVHRLRDGTVLSNSWFDSYGGLIYDDSSTGQRPYPSPDSVGYQGQWGAYTDVESRAYAQYLRWVFVDGDYYHPLTGSFLTRRSAGTNEYVGTVNPAAGWLDILQDVAQLAGAIDPTGAVDLTNSLVYALRGKWELAAVSLAGVVPYVGDLAKAGRSAKSAIATAKTAAEVERGVSKGIGELAPVVIGENMDRVKDYAKRIGAKHINDFIPAAEWTPELNRQWLQQMMTEGRKIIDIGPHFERRWRRAVGIEVGAPRSQWYEMERRMLSGYSRYKKAFKRSGKWSGGVEGLQAPNYSLEPFSAPFPP